MDAPLCPARFSTAQMPADAVAETAAMPMSPDFRSLNARFCSIACRRCCDASMSCLSVSRLAASALFFSSRSAQRRNSTLLAFLKANRFLLCSSSILIILADARVAAVSIPCSFLAVIPSHRAPIFFSRFSSCDSFLLSTLNPIEMTIPPSTFAMCYVLLPDPLLLMEIAVRSNSSLYLAKSSIATT